MSTQVSKPMALSAGLVEVKAPTAAVQPSAGPIRAMSLKLDDVRYRRLKLMGLEKNKTSQDLLSEAVDLLLKHG